MITAKIQVNTSITPVMENTKRSPPSTRKLG